MIRVHETYEYKTIFTQDDVKTFAELTNDMNPYHIDHEFASKHHFGRQVAQGVLISCAFSKVLFTLWPGDEDSFFISQDVMYFKPVFVDEEYTIKLECTKVDEQRAIGTIEGFIKDNAGNDIVKFTARISSKKSFSAPSM